MPIRVYLGYDSRQDEAYRVAEASILKHASRPVSITPLKLDRLTAQGLIRRPLEKKNGRLFDVISGVSQSTEFANSRFIVPILAQTGYAIFMDCDIVCLSDIAELYETAADSSLAVSVVQHGSLHPGSVAASLKMDGQEQLVYGRKNWSSVMFFNADHHANRRLTLDVVNGARGLDLHQFCWLSDNEIGSLEPEWNWLVGVQPKPDNPKCAHFTLGLPNMPGYEKAQHSEIWLKARKDLK